MAEIQRLPPSKLLAISISMEGRVQYASEEGFWNIQLCHLLLRL